MEPPPDNVDLAFALLDAAGKDENAVVAACAKLVALSVDDLSGVRRRTGAAAIASLMKTIKAHQEVTSQYVQHKACLVLARLSANMWVMPKDDPIDQELIPGYLGTLIKVVKRPEGEAVTQELQRQVKTCVTNMCLKKEKLAEAALRVGAPATWLDPGLPCVMAALVQEGASVYD